MINIRYRIKNNKKKLSKICTYDEFLILAQDLIELICNDNNIGVLPDMPELLKLNCRNTGILKLPNMPKLTHLCCAQNKLTIIKDMPMLAVVDCNYNDITTLPSHLPNLEKLYCIKNKLTSIPIYPKLEVLVISENNLLNFPEMPNLKVLIFQNNNKKLLSFLNLPELTDLHYDDIHPRWVKAEDIKKLGYFPKIKKISGFNLKSDQIPVYT